MVKHSADQAGHAKEYHVPWTYRREAFVWGEGQRIRPNFHAAATELHRWMNQTGKLSIYADRHKPISGSITNPYTYHLSSITLILGEVINSCHDFSIADELTDPEHAEIARIRLHNELVLYFARLYEGVVKQLLFLTSFSPRRYSDSAIGGLLSFDCRPCRKSGRPHAVSLLGSLTHPYRLCLEFEGCLYGTMRKINRMRSSEAAHATAQAIGTRTSKESQQQLGRDYYNLGTAFSHSLEHLAKLEQAIFEDLSAKCGR